MSEPINPPPTESPDSEPPPSPSPQVARPLRTLIKKLDWRIGSILVLAAVSIPLWRAVTSHAKPTEPGAPALAQAQPVAVAKVAREDLYNEVKYYAEFRPYQQVELHAKVSGYLEEINVDFGDRVKAGQLLARLEVPELKDELDQAQATLKRTQADYRNAHLIYTRLAAVDKDHPNLVAQQELDSAEAKDRTTEAAIAAAQAEVEKYETLLAYTKITAPFDGVITRRFADPGALIQSGTASDTQSLPLVCVSDNYRLRLDFPVSVAYVKDVQLGEPVEVEVESLGNKRFSGTISRCTQRVDEATRKMTTEIEVPNPNLELVPGMYATVILKFGRHAKALTVPIEAVAAGQKPMVYVVNRNNQLEERPITTGLETPTKYEVLSGLKEGDLVVIGNRSQLRVGEKVEPQLLSSLAQQ